MPDIFYTYFIFSTFSLMVEELARWKSALTKRINELQENIKCLLEESKVVYDCSSKTHSCLRQTRDALQNTEQKSMPLGNIIDIAKSNLLLSKETKSILNIEDSNYCISNDASTMKQTTAERLAYNLLSNPVSLPNKPDAICNAVMGAAMSLSSGQLYLQHPTLHATCCAHCRGEVQDV